MLFEREEHLHNVILLQVYLTAICLNHFSFILKTCFQFGILDTTKSPSWHKWEVWKSHCCPWEENLMLKPNLFKPAENLSTFTLLYDFCSADSPEKFSCKRVFIILLIDINPRGSKQGLLPHLLISNDTHLQTIRYSWLILNKCH